MRTLLLVLACLAPLAPAAARSLKIVTWNLNWLTLRPQGDPILPEDVHVRAPGDFARLRQYADFLNPDVAAIEEVDGPEAAARVFSPERYAVHMTHDRAVQRVGIAIRRGIDFTANPDVTGLDLDPDAKFPLRSGADVTLDLPGGPLRVLAVHLKSGCWERSLATHLRACADLREQLPPLEAWVAARQAEGVAFLVLGDFNRHLFSGESTATDPFFAALEQSAPLTAANPGVASTCWGEKRGFIDHILAGGPARGWIDPASFSTLLYAETDPAWKDRLSDHCPVSVMLNAPG